MSTLKITARESVRPVKPLDGFLGLLADKTTKVATLQEIEDAAAHGWLSGWCELTDLKSA